MTACSIPLLCEAEKDKFRMFKEQWMGDDQYALSSDAVQVSFFG